MENKYVIPFIIGLSILLIGMNLFVWSDRPWTPYFCVWWGFIAGIYVEKYKEFLS